MPAQANATSSGYDLDRPAKTIRFERQVEAEPARVFAAWTRPEDVTQWWDATGKPLLKCEIDLRVGGSFSFVVQDRPEMPFTGVYREIVPGERLVFEALGAIGRVTCEKQGIGTRVLVEIACTSAEQMEQFIQMGVHIGTSMTMDNLVRHVDAAAPRAAA
ncbi:SRPBCC domain-containing protein [Micromonospora sp. STR1s_5]|nr:SRPBCC domain-containing protein [Micromonospora sp. STR1s_5]